MCLFACCRISHPSLRNICEFNYFHLFLQEVFADATVICGNKRFEVHQFVLSTSSLYLETLFRTSPGSHPVLMFPDAPPAAMEQLLNFMYLGQTDVTSTELDELLDLAEDLRIIGLMHNSNKSHDQVC